MDAKNWWIAAKSSPEGEPLWLPLDYHLNDTAYVIDDLVKNWLPGAVYREIGLKRNECRKVAKFLALTHDIGKATPAFQKKILPMIPEMELHQTKAGYTLPAGLLDQNAIPHAHMGEALLRQREIDKTLTVIVGAHHGKPDNDIDSQDLEVYLEEYHRHFGYGDKNWMELQQHLICQALRNAGYDSKEELPELSEPAQMILTGLLIMADWIASNTYYFPLIPLDSDIREYDTGRSVRALKKLKLPEPCMMSDYWCEPEFYNERFGFTPNMIQTTMKNIAAGVSEPGILILEAPMGEGKTEGALAAAEVLMNRFDLGGVAFFLPSQATSNAMFSRILTWIRNQPDAERISVQLSHSNAELNEEFAQLEQGRVQLEEAADESIMVHSFFRGKKTKLLSDVVVGTVDQLLMAALTQKHVMLRHLGLAGKVVIIDECHAYDAYMNVYMDSILSWLGACHIPVLLLSATLPGKRREELLKAYAGKKATCEEDICASRAYPLISSSESGKIFLHPIHYEKQEREVELRKSTEEEAYVGVRKALDQGGCIGIILNTVKRVQEFAERIKEMFPEAEVWIDHSQFILSDRLKHEEEILKRVGKHSSPEQRRQVIVIGSQVLEQSLDLDFDLLITDLCPMDLLMQRIGRLHRHMRKRPQGLRAARCLVLNCSQTELEKGAEAIYGKYLLLRTESLLPDKIRLPGDISELVQKTYDEEEGRKEYPEACEEFQFQYQKSRRKAKSYCIRRPSRYEGDTISDLLMHDAALTDAKAEMAVRDGIASVEVLVVRQKDFYTAELIAGEDEGTELVMNAEPSYEEAKKIARQRLRLPSRFCQEYCVSQVIEELEDRTCGMVQEWTRHPILAGELIVVLDENNRTVIHNVRLCYDTEKGLLCEEDERGEGI